MKSEREESTERRPYRPPRLVRYGDLDQITRGGGGVERDGPGGAPKSKLKGGP